MNSKKIKIILGTLLVILLSSWSSKDFNNFSPKATYYHSSDGKITASGEKINLDRVKNGKDKWVAVSRDFITNRDFSFGDTVIINSTDCPKLNGEWVIQDLMGKKWKNKIDFLIHSEEVEDIKFYKPHVVKMSRKNKKRR